MARKKYTSEQIIVLLRQADVLSSQGKTQAQICKEIGIAVDTYIRWKKEYGGLRVEQAKRLKELEKENMRLKKTCSRLVA